MPIDVEYDDLCSEFTIPVFPDSQSEIDSNMGMFNSQLDWIIQNQKKENIPMVLHVGDIVNFDNLTHWDKASQGFARLDSAHIDYAITLGNHDNEAVQEYNGLPHPATRMQMYVRHLSLTLISQPIDSVHSEVHMNPARAITLIIHSVLATPIGW